MRKRKLLSIFLIICLFVSCMSISSYAVTPRYEGLAVASGSLTINTYGKSTSSFDIDLRSGYTADVVVTLFQYNFTEWTDIKSWTVENLSGSTGFEKYYYVMSDNVYYATFDITVYNSSGTVVDTATIETDLVYY